jgi:succinate dehydrogenase / fumarate reductase membrane anchor subunit
MAVNKQQKVPGVTVMRSPLGRARGLGSGKSGAGTWRAERVTSVALVPLSLWFVYSVLFLRHADHAVVAAYIGTPVHAVLFLALIAAMFPHLALGLRAVVEDYVRGELAKFFYLFAINAGCVLLALLAAISVLKLAI